jgi:hypothetical protein
MKTTPMMLIDALFCACVTTTTVLAAREPINAGGAVPSPASQLVGVVLTNGHLQARIVDNTDRFCPLGDSTMPGYNGFAALIYTGQGRNIFTPAGLNYESCKTVPKLGQRQDLWNAPRVAPMMIERLDAHTARLTQKGADAAGLNVEIVFNLGETYVDQTITEWPDVNIESSYTFWASYMNLVQNTSLYLHGVLKGEQEVRWLEMTSAGHNGSGTGTFFRPCDPTGKAWHEFLTDNPVRRQAVIETPESLAATERAGFKMGQVVSFDNFFFGFVDDYVALWIFRQPENGRFNPWISASGSEAVRRPAWDFGIGSGPQKAGERRTYYVRLVYKPFAGMDDVLKEVERFQAPGAP